MTTTEKLAEIITIERMAACAQSSREELLEDIEELKKKVTGATGTEV
jgi:hypothetical protein